MEKSILSAGRTGLLTLGLAVWAVVVPIDAAGGFTPESPEVRRAVGHAIRFLETGENTDSRLGAYALVGLVMVKEGKGASHPRVVQAVKVIQRQTERGLDPERATVDIYSASLCVMFLANLEPNLYAAEIQLFLDYLRARQKVHGGWGYDIKKTGDTSMTQNAVLSFWEATQAGYRIPVEMLDGAALWLLRTQDPSGGFGYQGVVAEGGELVRQSMVKPSLTGAGLGSLYILAELLELERAPREDDGLPPGMKEVKADEVPSGRSRIDPRRIQQALARGKVWMDAPPVKQPDYPLYNMYTLERYHSFREKAEGKDLKEPKWYNDGVRELLSTQQEDGSWKGTSGQVPATAFGVLFLIRSTQKRIKGQQSYGDGTLVGGRGLPRHTAGATIFQGKVVTKPELGSLDKLLDVLEEGKSPDLADTFAALEELPSEETGPWVEQHAKLLQELAADDSAEARLAAVRALGKKRGLDHVPTLIYALTDHPAIMREARDALRRISRKFEGFGLPDEPTDLERHAAIKKWQAWFVAIRPDADFEE